MAGQPESQALIQQIQTLKDKTHKLTQLTQQALDVMRQQGFRIKLNIDVDALMRETETDIRKIQRAGFELEQRVGQYEELVRTFALINSSLDLDKVLEEVMDTVIGLTGAERGYLMLTQPDGEFTIRSARNWDRETLNNESVTFSRGIIDQAIADGQPILTTNAQADDRFANYASVMTHDLRSVIVIPLILHSKVLGVLYVDNRINQTVFHQTALPLLTAFANQAAIAIQNARNMGQVRDDLAAAKREVARLKIQIDSGRVVKQVSQITESDYFQSLADKARDLRRRAAEDSGQEPE